MVNLTLHQHKLFLIVAEATKKDQKRKIQNHSFLPNQKILKSIENSWRKPRSKTTKGYKKTMDSNRIGFVPKTNEILNTNPYRKSWKDLNISIGHNFWNSYSISKIFGSGEWEKFTASNAYFSNFIGATLKNPFQSLDRGSN